MDFFLAWDGDGGSREGMYEGAGAGQLDYGLISRDR